MHQFRTQPGAADAYCSWQRIREIAEAGALLVRRGSIGYVVDVGTFLQDQVIYSVNFLDEGKIVGCREEELIGAEEAWTPSRFEFRDKVKATRQLAVGGEVLITVGAIGEVMKVIRDAPGGVAYHIHFDDLPGRVLQIPESILEGAGRNTAEDDEG